MEVKNHIMTSIIRQRSSSELQDIVSTIRNNGTKCPLASTNEIHENRIGEIQCGSLVFVQIRIKSGGRTISKVRLQEGLDCQEGLSIDTGEYSYSIGGGNGL
jgi:hypothetical protein